MPILRNENFFLALNLPPTGKLTSLAAILDALPLFHEQPHLLLDILELNPLVSPSVIHLANSSYFKHSTACDTLQQCLDNIGIHELTKLTLLTLAHDFLTTPLTRYSFAPSESWDISILTANLLERLAPSAGITSLQGYAIGLFHAFGRYIIENYLNTLDEPIKTPRTDYFNLARWERGNIGMGHASTATVIMVKWGLPEYFFRPIEFQNRPLGAGNRHLAITCLLNISIHLAAYITLPDVQPDPVKTIQPEILKGAAMNWRNFYQLEGPARVALMKTHFILTRLRNSDEETEG